MIGNVIKFWDKIKSGGENIGFPFLIVGFLVLLLHFALVIRGPLTETGLLGASLGLISVGLGFISIGMANKGDKWARARLASILGTVEEENYAELDLARNPQSGTYQLTSFGKEDVIYDSSKYKTHPFLFGNAWIRLDSMHERDIVRIRLYVTEDGKDSQVSVDEDNTYAGIQPTMVKISGGFYNKEGVKITAEQLAVHSAPIKIDCYVYDAMRGG